MEGNRGKIFKGTREQVSPLGDPQSRLEVFLSYKFNSYCGRSCENSDRFCAQCGTDKFCSFNR